MAVCKDVVIILHVRCFLYNTPVMLGPPETICLSADPHTPHSHIPGYRGDLKFTRISMEMKAQQTRFCGILET